MCTFVEAYYAAGGVSYTLHFMYDHGISCTENAVII